MPEDRRHKLCYLTIPASFGVGRRLLEDAGEEAMMVMNHWVLEKIVVYSWRASKW